MLWLLIASSIRFSRCICFEIGAGYGDTLGEETVLSEFERYLGLKDLNPARVALNDEHLDDFLSLLTHQRLRDDDEGGKTEH